MRRPLFRLPRAVPRDPAIDRWLDTRPDPLGTLARQYLECMRSCGDDVRETMHDDQPTACVGDAAFAYVDAFTAHVNVGFFRGADLADPDGLLQGEGRVMRHVKLRPGADIDARAVRALIDRAYHDMRARLAALPDRRSPDTTA